MADQLQQTTVAITATDEEDLIAGEGRSKAGIDVQKVLHRGQFEVPSLVYRIQSAREEVVTVRLVDRIPEGLPMEGVGFHESSGKQYWSVLETVVMEFVRRVKPDESVITVCGIQLSDATGVSVLLEPPELEVSADRGGESDEGEPSEDDQAPGATETVADDSTRQVEADEKTEADDGWGDVTLDLEDTTGNDASGATSDDAGEDPDRNAGELATDRVAGSLLEELRAGELTETEKRRLREEINLSVGETASSYVDHLHDRVEEERSRLESRLDSLEGEKADRQAVEALQSDVAELERLSARATHLEALAERVDELESVVTMEADLEELSAEVDDLTDRAASEERVDSITRALEAEYVTEDDVAETIDEGLDDRLRDVAPFGAGVCLASLGVGLAASPPFWGTEGVLLGGGVAGTW